jgi:hypothetical protein
MKEEKNPTTYTNLYTIFQSNEIENSKLKKVRRTKRERERERGCSCKEALVCIASLNDVFVWI